jgi:hypothetical protein
MADIQHPFTPSIADLRRRHGDKPLPAAVLINDLFRTHSEYAPRISRPIQIPENSSEVATVDEWLVRVGVHYRPSALDVLHGRLVIIGLALTSPEIRDHLMRRSLLEAVAAEIKEGVAWLLTPQAQKDWRQIEAAWNPRAAALDDEDEDLESFQAWLQSKRRPQSEVHQASGSHGQGEGTSQAAAVSPGGATAGTAGIVLEGPTLAEVPADTRGYVSDEKTQPDLPSHAGYDFQNQSAAGAVVEYVQSNVQAPIQQQAQPDLPPLAKGEPSTPPAAAMNQETVPAHPDDPAVLDTLARRPFARCIAGRMDEVWKGRDRRPTRRGEADTGSGGAFMLHLHGPWGSGKSSILNFLRDELQDEQRDPKERWVVVEFNAWRHQRIRPPWWALIRDVYAQSARQLPLLPSLWLRVRWWAWRVRADWLPVAAAAVIITVAALVILGAIDLFPAPPDPTAGTPASRQADEATWKGVDLALKVLTGLLAAWGVISTAGRSLAFGSARAAQTYTDLKSDPLGPIVRLFQRLTGRIGRPIAVFIDDLDRCDGKYVVELLEGIQTLFRTAPVTYVVAADRKWICASFQQGYKDFGDDIGEAGRPLGYLFLDKLFQVSASVPRPAPQVQRAYWATLLRAAGTTDAGALEERRRQAEQQAQREVRDLKTTEELQAFVQAAADPVQEEGRRAVAAQRITTPEAQRETQKHLLEGFADLLEPNPRSMKRLVNAYGLHQATHFLEHRHVAPNALARWTIIELRWPLLADHLSSHPESLAALGTDGDGVPAALKPLFRDPEVTAVLHGGAGATLDEPTLRQIVGSVDARQAGEPAAAAASDSLMFEMEAGDE